MYVLSITSVFQYSLIEVYKDTYLLDNGYPTNFQCWMMLLKIAQGNTRVLETADIVGFVFYTDYFLNE